MKTRFENGRVYLWAETPADANTLGRIFGIVGGEMIQLADNDIEIALTPEQVSSLKNIVKLITDPNKPQA